jgi:5-methylcytosine-specific restriction enzyme subunit McrC
MEDFVQLATRFDPKGKLRMISEYNGYMTNLRRKIAGHIPITGVLLYPRVEQSLNLRFSLHGYGVQVWTVDLTQEWPAMKQDLLQLLEPIVAHERSNAVL